jgi:hypothetical protein
VEEEITDRHFARHDERGRAGEQAESQQYAAGEFDERGEPFKIEQLRCGPFADGKPKYFERPCCRNSRAAMMRRMLRT